MADVLVWMTADSLGLSARLLTLTSSNVLAFAWPVARFPTKVRATLQFLSTNLTAACILQPALNVLQILLAAHAALLDQEGTFWAVFIVEMTVVLNLRMSACLWTVALITTRRWLGAAWQRRLEGSAATVAVYFVKDGFSARTAGTFMAELLAKVIAALERATTWTCTNVFWFKTIVMSSRSRVDGTTFTLDS